MNRALARWYLSTSLARRVSPNRAPAVHLRSKSPTPKPFVLINGAVQTLDLTALTR